MTTNKCVCQQNYREVGVPVCEGCHYSCLTCENSLQSSCLTCSEVNLRRYVGGYCMCAEGFYDNGSDSVCVRCHYSCLTCNGGSSGGCESCDSFLLRELKEGECACKAGFYDSGISLCSLCDVSCKKCSADANVCEDCEAAHERYLEGTICKCNDGYFNVLGVAECQECD